MKRAGIVVAAVLLALVVALGAAGWFGPDLVKDRVEAAAGRSARRAVTIGSLALLPAWPPLVQARDVAIAGVGRVERIDASVIPASVFSGRPRLDTLTLVRPDVVLRGDLRGFADRRLQAAEPVSAEPVSAGAAPPARHAPTDMARQVDIRDGHIVWHDPATGAGVDLLVAGAMSQDQAALSAHGTLTLGSGSVPVAGMLTGDPGLAAGKNLRFEATIGTGRVVASIDRAAPAAPPGVEAALAAPDGAAFGAPFGLRLPPGALQAGLHATLSPAARRDGVTIDRFSVQSGAGDLSGALQVGLGVRDTVRGTIQSQRLDLDQLLATLRLPTARRHSAPGPAAPSAPPPRPAAAEVIPDQKLLLPARLDLDLAIAADNLIAERTPVGALSGHLLLQHGRLALDPLQVTPPGAVPAQAALHYGAGGPSSLVLHAPQVPLAPLLSLFALPPVASGMADAEASLTSRGDSPRALAANLDGTLSIRMTGGELDAAVLAPLLARSHLPLAVREGTEHLRCLDLQGNAVDGRAAVAPLVVDAGRVAVSGSGLIDLGAETFDLHVRPLVRLGASLSVPLRVTGPWRDPVIASDTELRAPEPPDPCAAVGIAAVPLGRIKPPKAADILRGLLR